jgi:hypothetical protein
MANPRIEVEIGAKTDGLIRGVDGVILSMKQLKDESKKIEDALETSFNPDEVTLYNNQLAKLKAGMNALKSQGVDPLTKATSNYNGVGVEFSRIIQDAPFGIIGVGNNITRLAETFQNLRTQSTSTGAALKTALTSIISPANLLVLGISAVTTALTLWQMGAFESGESTKSLADAAKDAKEEMEEFRLSLDSVTQARIKGESSASKEIGDLKLLREQAENTNVTQKKRLEAVDALQKQYPETLGNLSKEQILAGDVGTAYEGLTKQIIATSKARAFSDKISENSLELLTIEEQTAKKAEEILKLREKQAQLDENASKIDRSGLASGVLTGADLSASSNQSKINNLVQEQVDLINKRNKINAENLTLETKITEQIGQGATFTKQAANSKSDSSKSIKKLLIDLKDYDEKLKKISVSSKDFEAAIQKISNQRISTESLNNKLNDTDFTAGVSPPTIEVPEVDDSNLSKFVVRLAEFNSQVANVIQNGAQNTLGDFAFSIGDALATGGNVLKAAGASLLSGLAGILNQLGQLAIGAGLAIGGIKKALTTLNPAVAIAAGVALVGLAGFVSAKAKSLGGGVGGGGGSSVGSSVASQSFSGGGVGGLGGGVRDLTGELVVRGADLVYVLGQSNNKIAKG